MYILGLQNRPTSKWAAWQFLSDRLVDGVDTGSVYDDRDWFQEQYDNASSPAMLLGGECFLKIEQSYKCNARLVRGDTSYTALSSWMVRLYNYDEINAGTENFVVSIYQHFFHRYPTDVEVTSF